MSNSDFATGMFLAKQADTMSAKELKTRLQIEMELAKQVYLNSLLESTVNLHLALKRRKEERKSNAD